MDHQYYFDLIIKFREEFYKISGYALTFTVAMSGWILATDNFSFEEKIGISIIYLLVVSVLSYIINKLYSETEKIRKDFELSMPEEMIYDKNGFVAYTLELKYTKRAILSILLYVIPFMINLIILFFKAS